MRTNPEIRLRAPSASGLTEFLAASQTRLRRRCWHGRRHTSSERIRVMRSRTTRIVTVTAALVAAAAVGAGGGAATFAALGSDGGSDHRPPGDRRELGAGGVDQRVAVRQRDLREGLQERRRDHVATEPVLAHGRRAAGPSPGLRLRLRRRGPHRHEPPRRRRRRDGLRPLLGRLDLRRDRRRHRPLHRSRRHQGRRARPRCSSRSRSATRTSSPSARASSRSAARSGSRAPRRAGS